MLWSKVNAFIGYQNAQPNRTDARPQGSTGGYLQKALWQGQMAFAILLFAYCVEAFKRKPTKRKSIYIWNTFLRIQFDPTIAADDPFTDLTIECDQELLNNAKDWIDTAIRMRQSAEQMNRLVRFFSTSDREVPPTMFDTIIAGMIAKTGDSPLGRASAYLRFLSCKYLH